METIRNNLNSVRDTCSLAALRKQLSTCYQNCRKTLLKIHLKHEQQQNRNQNKRFTFFNQISRDNLVSFKLNENLKNLKLKVGCKKSTSRVKLKSADIKQADEGKVKEVAYFLANTLKVTGETIKDSTKTKPDTTFNCTESSIEKIEMTIDDTFDEVRQLDPDIDKVVRSILMAHCQNGATVTQIKSDYLRNTGSHFPVLHHICDFLLTIPNVSAVCTEQGHLIFSIVPTAKTKHLYNLVMGQMAPRTSCSVYSGGSRNRRTHFSKADKNKDNFWIEQFNYEKISPYIYKDNIEVDDYDWEMDNKSSSKTNENLNMQPTTYSPDQISNSAANDLCQEAKIIKANAETNDNNLHESTHQNQTNIYYQDNCNYLKNRFHSRTRNDIMSKYVNNQNASESEKNLRTSLKHNKSKNYNNKTNNNIIWDRMSSGTASSAPLRPTSLLSVNCNRNNQQSKFTSTSYSNFEAHLFDFPLLGDDFIMFLARMELKCKFRKHNNVLNSGLCVSGQTIRDAIKFAKKLPHSKKSIIINIGSVDILKGKPLIQIEHDFRELINVIVGKGMTPILTTLAPLANHAFNPQIKTKLEKFNNFIKKCSNCLQVIDIWPLFVSWRGNILFECYQTEPRKVTGCPEPHVFWNNIGRKRVLQLIESQLEY